MSLVGWRDHDRPVWVLAFGEGTNSIDFGDRIMNNLAIRCVHRLQHRLLGVFLYRFRKPSGIDLQRFTTPSPITSNIEPHSGSTKGLALDNSASEFVNCLNDGPFAADQGFGLLTGDIDEEYLFLDTGVDLASRPKASSRPSANSRAT